MPAKWSYNFNHYMFDWFEIVMFQMFVDITELQCNTYWINGIIWNW